MSAQPVDVLADLPAGGGDELLALADRISGSNGFLSPDERNAIATELRRLASAGSAPAPHAWRPIDTAPRDGRDLILLLTPSGWPQVAYSNTWWTAGFSVECMPIGWAPIPPLAAAPTPEQQS